MNWFFILFLYKKYTIYLVDTDSIHRIWTIVLYHNGAFIANGQNLGLIELQSLDRKIMPVWVLICNGKATNNGKLMSRHD